MKLEDLTAQLKGAYGDTLQAIILYGSAVAGEHIAKRSDYNIIVVADSVPLGRLQSASSIARAWNDAGNPPPMTFTLSEWRASSDIFPMEYSDILERHKLLYGDESVFQGISVKREHIRLQLENQAVGKLLQLRQGALMAGTELRRQIQLMEDSLSTFMVISRALVRLHGDVPPTDYEQLARRVAELASFDPTSFVRVVRHVRGSQKLQKADTPATLSGYLEAAEKLAAYVNRV